MQSHIPPTCEYMTTRSLEHREKHDIKLGDVLNKVEDVTYETNNVFPGHIDFLTYSRFSTECCPSVYTNSSGCLCFDNNEDKLIITRGGNRHFTKRDHMIDKYNKINKIKKRQDKTTP
jgi:hypothetical protein